MTCPKCSEQSRVTKTITNGGTTTRYRTCKTCTHHFITIEVEASTLTDLRRVAEQSYRNMRTFHAAIHDIEEHFPF